MHILLFHFDTARLPENSIEGLNKNYAACIIFLTGFAMYIAFPRK